MSLVTRHSSLSPQSSSLSPQSSSLSPRSSSLVTGRVGILRWREEDQDHQLLGDAVKAMFVAGFDEHHATGRDIAALAGDLDCATAARNVVDLVFGVRLLWVDAAGRQHIQPGAERRHAQKFQVGPLCAAALVE